MSKRKSTANAPMTGEVTTINSNSKSARPTMNATGDTLTRIQQAAGMEVRAILELDRTRIAGWLAILKDGSIRTVADWAQYAAAFRLAAEEYLAAKYGFDRTKGTEAWTKGAKEEWDSRWKGYASTVNRVGIAIEKVGVPRCIEVFEANVAGKVTYHQTLALLPSSGKGRRAGSAKPKAPAKVDNTAKHPEAEVAGKPQGQATDQSKASLANAAAAASYSTVVEMVKKIPREFLPGFVSFLGDMLGNELAPEWRTLSEQCKHASEAFLKRINVERAAKDREQDAAKGTTIPASDQGEAYIAAMKASEQQAAPAAVEAAPVKPKTKGKKAA